MRIDVLTLFPNAFSYFDESILARAKKSGALEINIINIRDFSKDPHKKCDDYCFGGGSGMLMTPQPLYDAIMSVKTENSKVIYLSPKGKVFTQQMSKDLSKQEHLIFVCGHYEGIDQRIIDLCVDMEICIGDYVLTGGELPAMVVVDAISRHIEGVLGNEQSTVDESFSNNTLEYPQYTRPQEFMGLKVPDVLVSGNHQKIKEFKEKESQKLTQKLRPDLLKGANDED